MNKEIEITEEIERLCIKWADGDESAALLLNQIFGEEKK
jgi:hypothetical protein